MYLLLVSTLHAPVMQAGAKASREDAAAAKQAEVAAQQDLEAAREVISSLTNQLALTDGAAEQVGWAQTCNRDEVVNIQNLLLPAQIVNELCVGTPSLQMDSGLTDSVLQQILHHES